MVRPNLEEAPHILAVDDDRRLRQLLKSYLAEQGFRVTAAASAAEARRLMEGVAFDVMILDIMMPGENGLAFIELLRDEGRRIPVLMLSALAEPEDRVTGLSAGSDDYLTKPFEPRELELRLRNMLRHAAPAGKPPGEVRFGPHHFNLARGELRKDGKVVRLTTREKEMLRLLAERAGSAVGRGELAQPAGHDSGRGVDVQINRLRQKIEADPSNPVHLQTVRGAGYILQLD